MKKDLTDEQFLEQLGESAEGTTLEIIRLLRTSLANFSVPRLDPKAVLPSDQIESDLGIHHMDSLDLVDFATSIESESLTLQATDLQQVAELNRRDGTVKELTSILLSASRREK